MGRPTVPPDIRALIRDMSNANPRWGAPRIHGELLKLRIDLPDVQRQRSSVFAVAEKMRLALVPPKPKEFVIACVIGIGKAQSAITFKALSASGISRFVVGGAT
jgi:hypothetical protein